LLNLAAAQKIFRHIISLTGNLKSSLAKHSDVRSTSKSRRKPVVTSPDGEHDGGLVMATRWRCVLQARGFKQKDYARLHPSGAIGARCC